MRRLTACQECWDHWIACMYDGTIILLLFRGATGEMEAVADHDLWFWYTASGLLAAAMTSISWMPVPYTSALLMELTLALILIMLFTMMMCFQSHITWWMVFTPLLLILSKQSLSQSHPRKKHLQFGRKQPV